MSYQVCLFVVFFCFFFCFFLVEKSDNFFGKKTYLLSHRTASAIKTRLLGKYIMIKYFMYYDILFSLPKFLFPVFIFIVENIFVMTVQYITIDNKYLIFKQIWKIPIWGLRLNIWVTNKIIEINAFIANIKINSVIF